MGSTLVRLVKITDAFVANRGHPNEEFAARADSAVCQDAWIFGVDVDDFVHELDKEFGSVVWQIPWGTYTDQTASFRGWGVFAFPFWFVARVAKCIVCGGLIVPRPNPSEFPRRLELRHVAAVIEKGEWFDP